MTEGPLVTPSSLHPPAVVEQMRALYADARAAGFEDPLFGALVIATTALVRIEQEVGRGRGARDALD